MNMIEQELRVALENFVTRHLSDARLWPVDTVHLRLAAYRLLHLFEESDDAE
jgi:hypothetical protein